jgi:hypothetical protein
MFHGVYCDIIKLQASWLQLTALGGGFAEAMQRRKRARDCDVAQALGGAGCSNEEFGPKDIKTTLLRILFDLLPFISFPNL